jgi:CNT family concentrative nucleoside transporter
MDRYFGLTGILAILLLAWLMSNNRKAINKRVVLSGLLMQVLLAIFILKVPFGRALFATIGHIVTRLLSFSDKGAQFAFGALADPDQMAKVFGPAGAVIFFFKIIPTIVFVTVLVSIGYYFGIIQRFVSLFARGVYWIMRVSGAEALSNISSAFVGQVEAQIMIRPYLAGMTNSELLASMTGSMACIAGGVMAVYIAFGVPAQYLLAASLMAAPGALVISKIVYPETETSETRGSVKLKVEKQHYNLIDAIVGGGADGLKIGLNVTAMVIAFIALISLVDAGLGYLGHWLAKYFNGNAIGIDLEHLGLNTILGNVFSVFAYLIGVPYKDIHTAGTLLGTKMVTNEFIAYYDFTGMMKNGQLSQKTITILSFALCGFANFGSIGVQVGGIGQIVPERKKDLARLGFRALICGTMASYMSAAIAGILT